MQRAKGLPLSVLASLSRSLNLCRSVFLTITLRVISNLQFQHWKGPSCSVEDRAARAPLAVTGPLAPSLCMSDTGASLDTSVSICAQTWPEETSLFPLQLYTVIASAVTHKLQFSKTEVLCTRTERFEMWLTCFKNMWCLSSSHWTNSRTFPKILPLHKICLKFLRSYFQSLEPILWIVLRLANPLPLRTKSILETAQSQIWWLRWMRTA